MVGKYPTGASVTIDIYDLSDNSLAVDGAAVTEIGGTGYFKYNYSALIDPTKEFLYVMTDGTTEVSGKLVFRSADLIGEVRPLPPASIENSDAVWDDTDGAAVTTQTTELHKLQGLTLGKPMTVTPTSRIVDDVELAITGDGETTSTVERQ
jgi:hypothetical protein